jgi:dihydrofolate reductase
MSATVLYMSMSLDGYVAGPNERLDNGLGDNGMRLHDWFFADKDEFGKLSGVNGTVAAEAMATGAVFTGRRTFELGGGWGGDHHDGVPIYVFTRSEPDRTAEKKWPLVTYVTDVATAVAEAKRAAGGKNVMVHGIGTARLALAAGVLDELEIHLVPVLLGQGRRLFPERDAAHIELERTRTIEGEAGITHLHYRVRH